jgi:hypothetical protein
MNINDITKLPVKAILDSCNHYINDYILYYDRWELLDKGRTKLFFAHQLCVEHSLAGRYNYEVAITLSNPHNRFLTSLEQLSIEFFNKLCNIIASQTKELNELGRIPTKKAVITIKGDNIYRDFLTIKQETR